ncbi:ChbG/HpnK family deacetylase [Candidatus Peregrinibacteria bacterium]|nr:ChbG/HpnK family deacetylase [Candidatus Peregrinibacteria bacterium]
MRRLIINADDLGINPSRDHGIFECFERGVLTSATMIATGSGAQRAGELARRMDMPTGLHFNITEGFPVNSQKNIASLLTPDGLFLDPRRLRRAIIAGHVDPRHIEREFRAQMERFMECRKTGPTHVDSHHNMHAHRQIVAILAPLIPQYDISCVRIADEPPPADYLDMTDERKAYLRMLAEESRVARSLYEAHGLRSTDHFRGLAFSGNAGKKAFRQLVRTIPEGTTELMVHPGQCDPGGDEFSMNPQRETEMEMLTDEEMPAFAARQKIEMISFRDLQ